MIFSMWFLLLPAAQIWALTARMHNVCFTSEKFFFFVSFAWNFSYNSRNKKKKKKHEGEKMHEYMKNK